MSDLIVDTKKNLESFGLICPHIVNSIHIVLNKNTPELRGILPFTNSWKVECYHENDFMILFLKNALELNKPHINSMDSNKVELIKNKTKGISIFDFNTLYSIFGKEYYDLEKFLYVGISTKSKEPKKIFEENWETLTPILAPWMDNILIPSLYNLEKVKLEKIIPKPIKLEIAEITNSLWILECEETSKQGTAFAIEGFGLVTCEHVLGTMTKAFKFNDVTKKYDVIIEKKNSIIDVAILKLKKFNIKSFLKKGNSEHLEQLSQVTISGFPNYRLGDSGTIITGNISGFRTVSGIRRLLVSMPLIAGNSGSPILDSKSRVIGIAVTGADRMENAHQTEHHGVIPIEVLNLLQ